MSATSSQSQTVRAQTRIECILKPLSASDMNDLCDACDLSIKAGGGFGWVKLPARDKMERYWEGLIAVPNRVLFVSRLDDVIAGAAVLICPPVNNEAQAHAVTLTGNFVAPWARGHGLSREMLETIENFSRDEGFKVINLEVDEDLPAAINLYETSGYIKTGTHPYATFRNGKYIQAHSYTKLLDIQRL